MRNRIDNAVLGMIFGSVGPLAFFAPKGLWLPILLVLLFRMNILASVPLDEYARIGRRNAVFLVLPAFAIFSSGWAIVPGNAFVTGIKLLVYVLAACLAVVVIDRMSEREKRRILACTAAGLAVASLCVLTDLATSGAIFGLFKAGQFAAVFYSRGAAIAACALLPVTAGLYYLSGARLAAVFAVISVATVFFLLNEGSKVAVVLGLTVFAIVHWRSILFWPILLVPLFIGVVFPSLFLSGFSDSTLCTWFNIKPSAAHRLAIYEFASQKALSKPLLGWGMDASRSIPGGRDMVAVENCRYQGGASTRRQIGAALPLHPHNAALQVWLELGAVGVVITVGLLAVLIARLQRYFAAGQGRAIFAGLFTTIYIIYNIGFGLWQSWLIFALILICMNLRALRPDGSETTSTPAIGREP